MDFFEPTRKLSKGVYYVYPKFKICRSKDLMIRGGDFYAIWDEDKKIWSRDQDDVIRIVDAATKKYIDEHSKEDETYRPLYMWDADSGIIDKWNKYVQRQMKDNYKPLDSTVIFSNTDVKREDYSTHRLNYPLEKGPIDNYEELMNTLYDPEERKKLEFCIGSIVAGDSVWIQKFFVLVGEHGTGKSTFLKIVRMLFDGYCATIDAKAICSGKSDFALESLRNDPLVALQDDVDLSKVVDNTVFNSIVSHEMLSVNEKFKSHYDMSFKCMILLGSNYSVRITDSNSGLIRRLVDVSPSGRKVPVDRYREIMKQIKFELPGIAFHCLNVYRRNKDMLDDYVPVRMLRNTNYVYSFLEENVYSLFAESPDAKLQTLWIEYQNYVEMAKIQYPHNRQEFRKELEPYFEEVFHEYIIPETGRRVYGYFKGFKFEKFGLTNPFEQDEEIMPEVVQKGLPEWLKLNSRMSIFDKEMAEQPAQYANEEGIPTSKWANCKTKLKDIQTSQTHFVKVPLQHIVIDLDIRGEDGQKSAELNLQAARQFPPTYAEYSKSGSGLHLHYIYDGDVEKLSRIFDNNIEVKVFTGNSSLRRRVSLCNNLDISHINSGLPLKGDDVKLINTDFIWDDKKIHAFIKRCIRKEHHGATAPEVQFIYSELEKAYAEGVKYDVSDLRPAVLAFANASTNQSEKCLKLVSDMKWKAKIFEVEETIPAKETYVTTESYVENDNPIAFFDVEIFPNLFVICFQRDDSDEVEAMVNPEASDVEWFVNHFRLIGFNNLGYDNHMVYAAMMGYSVKGLYDLSKRIITGDKTAKFSEAYQLSYTDIYDFAITKQSLKKWEIAMGMHHLELGLPWDEPVPKSLIEKVVAYCKWDVKATKRLFYFIEDDWNARRVLAELSGLTVNHSTNSHTQQIIFGNDQHPQSEFVYTHLAETFPGYKFENGVSTYMGIEVGEGGWAHGEPGIWLNAFLDDIASMHPHSLKALNAFGDKYTKRYYSLVETRVYIKHGEEEKARAMFDGRIGEIADKLGISLKGMSKALKLPINSVYGLTAAKFPNRCRDPRNVDNIVAKRGALFMITLVDKIKKEGYDVAHIKTDSIKVPDAPEPLQEMIFDFARQYGYEFEHEATYDRMCLVNDAVYIAKYADGAHEYELSTGETIVTPWTATGTQFAVPYVFKTLFANEPVNFDDCCEVKSSRTGPIYLDMNEGLPDVSELEKERKKLLKHWSNDGLYLLDNKNVDKNRLAELEEQISKGHNYIFIGNVGQFTPVKSGCGGGVLVCKRGDKYVNVTGSTGYRWLESEIARESGGLDIVDTGYYRRLCDEAIDTINSFGDFDVFVNAENHKSPELRAIARNLPF